MLLFILLHLDTKFYLITTAKNKKTKIFPLISQKRNFIYLLRPGNLLRITKILLFVMKILTPAAN